MAELIFQDLGHGITCIDADYVDPGIACFYLLQEGDEYALIETGTSRSVDALVALLAQRGIKPGQVRYVIPTHVHLDHAGGAGAMMAVLPQAQLLIHPRGARHMADPGRLVDSAMAVYGEKVFKQLYGDVQAVDERRMRPMQDGETVQLAGRVLQMRHTRGHANHHFCVWDERSSGWFTGDMFGVSYPWLRFAQGDFLLPSTTPTQFDPQAYLDSLDLLHSYHPRRVFLTHSGELQYTAEKSQLLRQQVVGWRDLALEWGCDATQLKTRMADFSLHLLQRFDAASTEAQQREWLEFDLQLNVQGLCHWLQQT